MSSNQIAFILCGGKATRLKGINQGIPKSLLKISGKSLLSHLIQGIDSHFCEIFVSYVNQLEKYTDTLNRENKHELLSKVKLVKDEQQKGTALATQNAQLRNQKSVCVINGDTLFNNYENLIPNHIPPDKIIISTSCQSVSNSSAIYRDPEDNLIKIKQDRNGKTTDVKAVSTGIISFGPKAFTRLKKVQIKSGETIERVALSLQSITGCTVTLYNTQAQFIDFGSPQNYENATSLYERILSNI